MICQNDRILLGLKKRGFGEGKLIGFGGKVNAGEKIEDAALREVFEEAQITPKDLEKMGVLEFTWDYKPEVLEVHIFKVTDFEGIPTEGDEMKPEWFSLKNIPYEKMWADDIYWLPMFLENKKFSGKFLLDKNDALVSHQLQQI